jgi:hypothetical protein
MYIRWSCTESRFIATIRPPETIVWLARPIDTTGLIAIVNPWMVWIGTDMRPTTFRTIRDFVEEAMPGAECTVKAADGVGYSYPDYDPSRTQEPAPVTSTWAEVEL